MQSAISIGNSSSGDFTRDRGYVFRSRAVSGLFFSPLVGLLLLGLCGSASAASFNVQPIRVFLNGSRPTGALKIRNISNRLLSLQLNAVEWSQDSEGKAGEKPTEEVVFFPKLFTLQKGKTRLIRVGLVNPKAGSKEKTFRIYMRELPLDTESTGTVIKVLLRIGVPVFLAPRVEKASGTVEGLRVEGRRIVFTVKNSGTVHLRLQRVVVSAFDDKGKKIHSEELAGWYLLSGVRRPFAFDLPADVCRRVKKVAVHIESDKLDIDREGHVPSGACKTP